MYSASVSTSKINGLFRIGSQNESIFSRRFQSTQLLKPPPINQSQMSLLILDRFWILSRLETTLVNLPPALGS